MDLLIIMDNIKTKTDTNSKKDTNNKDSSKRNSKKNSQRNKFKKDKKIKNIDKLDSDKWENTTYGTCLYKKNKNRKQSKIEIFEDTMWWCEDY